MGRDHSAQCAPSAGTTGLGTGRAARPARVGAPEEGVLISPDPLTSTQDAQRAGAVRTPRARRRAMRTLPLPQGDSGDWERPGPSNVSAACASAVISGGPGWAGGWRWRLCRGVRVSSPALRPSSAGGRALRCGVPAPSSPPPPDSLSGPTSRGWACISSVLGKRSWLLECEANPRGLIMPKAWGTSGPPRALDIPTRNTTQ